MLIRAGVLSDTHLHKPDSRFQKQLALCFQDCDVIIHAGDLTDPSVLTAFHGRPLFAVHGNMCARELHRRHPRQLEFTLGGFTIGLAHGAHLGPDIEDALWTLFPGADCLIYGHTHRPVCHSHGQVLVLNPGSFQATGRDGEPGTYAILEAGDQLRASLFAIPPIP